MNIAHYLNTNIIKKPAEQATIKKEAPKQPSFWHRLWKALA